MLISYTGCKSGKAYRQPVSYVRDGDVLLTPGGGRWTLNLADGRSARIRLRGRDAPARPELVPHQAGFAPPVVPHLMPRMPRSSLPRPRPRARHPLHTASMEHRCCSSGIGGTSLPFAGEGGAAQGRRGRGWRGACG